MSTPPVLKTGNHTIVNYELICRRLQKNLLLFIRNSVAISLNHIAVC